MKVLCLFFSREVPLAAIAEAFYGYSPQISLRRNEALYVEIEKCRHLYDDDFFLEKAREIAEIFKCATARVALAEDIPTALAFARHQIFKKEKLPIEALADYAFPFGIPESAARELEHLFFTLPRLGLFNLRDFQKLSSGSLTNRFGALGFHLHRALRDSSGLNWPLFRPSEILQEEQSLDDGWRVEDTESIQFVLRGILDRLLLRLRGRGQALRRFELYFELENHSLLREKSYRLHFDLLEPQMSLKTLLSVVRDRVQFELRQKPLGAPVTLVRLQALEMVPWIYAQKDLMNPHKEEKREQRIGVLSRLQIRLGKEAVFHAEPVENYLPESNWRRRDPFHFREIQARDRHPARPLRLLTEPRKIYFQEGFVTIGSRRLKVLSVEDHEILSGGLWNRLFERRYSILRAQDDGGANETYWVFLENQNLFLHGVFD